MASRNTVLQNVFFSSLLQRLATIGLRYPSFRPEQRELIYTSMKTDVLGILPTGFGKTVIMEAMPFLDPEERHPVLGITPLNAILSGQKEKYGEHAVIVDNALLETISECGPQTQLISQIIEGNILYILGHPEFITDGRFVKHVLRKMSGKITHCVVDEVHCLLSWGPDFRPAFLKIPTLKSTLQGLKFVGLTATASEDTRSKISTELRLSDPHIVAVSPDRPNLFIQVKQRLSSTGGDHDPYDSIDSVIDPFIKELVQVKGSFPKTVIFCSSLKWLGYCHHRTLSDIYDAEILIEKPTCVTDWYSELVDQYHAPQTAEHKEHIMREFANENGKLRLLFASEAFSMGVDVKDIRRIIHLGPPSSLEVYAQEIGRCGRDGHPAEVTMYFNKTDVRQNIILEENVRKFCSAKTCRREILLDYFGFHKDEKLYENGYACCDVCMGLIHEKLDDPKNNQDLYEKLCLYFDHINLKSGGPIASLESGLSPSLAYEISKLELPDPGVTRELLRAEFPDMKNETIDNVLVIMSAIGD